MIPHNAVNPAQSSTHFHVALNTSMDPTPPPEVVALTQYTYEEKGSGSDSRVKMWVTGTHREGPALICDGWLVRYPQASQPAYKQGNMAHNVSGGIAVSTAVGGSAAGGVLPPIVEAAAHVSCTQRGLAPFTRPPASSP